MNKTENVKIIISIKAKLETSNHNGYCSDNENEYKCEFNTYLIDLPEILITEISNINDFTNEELTNLSYKWESILPIIDVEGYSLFCNNSKKRRNMD